MLSTTIEKIKLPVRANYLGSSVIYPQSGIILPLSSVYKEPAQSYIKYLAL